MGLNLNEKMDGYFWWSVLYSNEFYDKMFAYVDHFHFPQVCRFSQKTVFLQISRYINVCFRFLVYILKFKLKKSKKSLNFLINYVLNFHQSLIILLFFFLLSIINFFFSTYKNNYTFNLDLCSFHIKNCRKFYKYFVCFT